MIRGRFARAFTFIELMFVITIMGILIAVVIPKMGGSAERSAVEATGRNLARLSEYARQVAISRQEEATLTIDQQNGRWWLELPAPEDDRYTRRIRNRGRGSEHVAYQEEEEINTLPPRLRFSEILVDGERMPAEEPVVITFYPGGNSSGAQVILKNNKNKTLTIEIEAATGRASAYTGEPKNFAQKLEEAGIDPGKYGLESSTSAAVATTDGKGFYRIGGGEERQKYYNDVAEKIMNRTRQEYERTQGEHPAQTTFREMRGAPGSTVPPR